MMPSKKIPIFLGLFVLFVYLLTLSSTLSFGDAGDLIAAAAVLGVPHPPGYPLHTILGWLFIHLIPFGSPALRVNLLSTAAGIFTVLLVYQIIHKLTASRIAAAVGSLFLAFSSSFWTYSIVTDVFALNAFFTALLVWIILEWRENLVARVQSRATFHLLKFSFVYGLALANHQTILFLAPAFLFLILATILPTSNLQPRIPSSIFQLLSSILQKIPPKLIGLSLLAFFLGLIPYLYIPIAASRHPYVNWEAVNSPQRFVRLLTRQAYGSGRWTSATASVETSTRPPVYQIPIWLTITTQQFTFVAWILIALGIFALRRSRTLLAFLLYGFLVPGLGFMLYTNLSYSNSAALSALERFLIMPGVFGAILIGCGTPKLASLIIQIIRLVNKSARFSLNLNLNDKIMLGLVALPLLLHWSNVSQRQEAVFYDYGKFIFDSVNERIVLREKDKEIAQPEKILLVTKGDMQHFAADYLQAAEKRYQNIYVLNLEMLTHPFYVEEAKRRFPDLVIPFTAMDGKTGFLNDLLSNNVDHFRIFVPQMQYTDLEQFYSFLPQGGNFWLLKKGNETKADRASFIAVNQKLFEQAAIAYDFSKKAPTYQEDYPWTWWAKEIALNYSVFRSNLGTVYQQNGFNDLAIGEFKAALAVAPQLVELQANFNLGVAYQNTGNFSEALAQYEKVIKLDQNFPGVYRNRALIYQGLGQKEQAIANFEKYLKLNPQDPEEEKIKAEIEKLRGGS